MKIGVLAVQGAFIEHENVLSSLGVESFEIRQKKDLENACDGLILPGGESTVMGKLLNELDLMKGIQEKIKSGMPVKVRRNAYGRQLGSFQHVGNVEGVGEIPMTFIRAPYIEKCGDEVEVLSTVDERIVAARYRNQLGISFHTEVTHDTRMYKYFLEMIK